VGISKKHVLEVALVFKKEMQKIGKDFKFSKSSDVTNTYQYRWFKSFLERCVTNHGLNLNESKEVIKCVVHYVNRHGFIKNGVSILSRKDIIDIACKKFESDISEYDNLIKDIEKCTSVICDDFYEFLIKKPRRNGNPNILILYNNGSISKSFIALSKSCIKAYRAIDNSELPPLLDIIKIRMRLMKKIGIDKIKEIMGVEFNG
jgi:hypothetical protein